MGLELIRFRKIDLLPLAWSVRRVVGGLSPDELNVWDKPRRYLKILNQEV